MHASITGSPSSVNGPAVLMTASPGRISRVSDDGSVTSTRCVVAIPASSATPARRPGSRAARITGAAVRAASWATIRPVNPVAPITTNAGARSLM